MMRKVVIGLAATTALALAQGPPPHGPRPMGPGGEARFLGAEPGMPGRVVKNAPYSADVTTESTQTLADGNHIHQTTNSHFSRDSEGRTRLEQSLNGLSAIAGGTTLPHVVFIHDPVAGQSYALNTNDKTATRSGMSRGRGGNPPPAFGNAMREPGRGRGPFGERADSQNLKTEALGRQTIEGVPADGTRTTLTIPAGRMGNEQPIQVVTERWYSPDLQTVVLSKHSDPRSGDTVTRVTNINRTEPSPTLFQVPADYKLAEDTRARPASPSKNE
jgi:hypothetical protein